MIRLAQIGFLVFAAIFVGLAIYHYPIMAILAVCLLILFIAGRLKSGSF